MTRKNQPKSAGHDREGRRFVGGYLTLHAAGGIQALLDEAGGNATATLEMLVNEALAARHPEWYRDDFKHPLEIQARAEAAKAKLAAMEAEMAEAQADIMREAAMNASARAA